MSEEDQLAMKKRVQRLVYIAAGGKIKEEELGHYGTDLRNLGLDSLGYLNLLEGLERTFGVVIDLDHEEDHSFLHTIDNIVQQQGLTAVDLIKLDVEGAGLAAGQLDLARALHQGAVPGGARGAGGHGGPLGGVLDRVNSARRQGFPHGCRRSLS